MLVLLLACTRTTEPVEPDIPSADAVAPLPPSPTEPILGEDPPAVPAKGAAERTVLGAWSSSSCEDRTHERFIHFTADGTFSGEERISPCPPGAACMWSGVHSFSGGWSQVEDTLSLTVSSTDAVGEVAASWPATLTYSGGRLLENDCLYGPAKLPEEER